MQHVAPKFGQWTISDIERLCRFGSLRVQRYLMGSSPYHMRGYWQYTETTTFWKHPDKLSEHIPKKYIAMQYKWKKAPLSSVLKTTPRHTAEDRTIIRLNLDPNVYLPMFDEYQSQMPNNCHHHPRMKNPTPFPINGEDARVHRLSSVTELPVSSNSLLTQPPPPPKLKPSSVTTPPARPSRPRRASISSNESSIILTMQIDVCAKPTVSAVPSTSPKSSTPAEASSKSAAIPELTSAAKYPATSHQSPANFESPTFLNAPAATPVIRETVLEWSARMKRYQQEEIQYLGLDIIKPHISLGDAIAPAKRTPPSKFFRVSPKWMVGDRSLSKQRFEEWLDTLHPKASPADPASEPSTVADSTGNVDALDLLPPMDPNVCNACGKSIWNDKRCHDRGVQTEVTSPPI